MPTPRQHTLHLLKFVRETSSAFLSGIPDDKLTHQSCPTDNHPLWVMGHIVTCDEWFGSILGIRGTEAPRSWDAIFGTRSTPTSDRSIYPPLHEVRERFDTSRQLIIEWLEAAAEDQLAVPLTEPTHGFASGPIDLLLKAAWHEGWHMGQVASARKALNLPRIIA
jgi:hypothetical protein